MTKRAALWRPPGTVVVSRVLELHIEALLEFGRKRPHRRIVRIDVLVADRTHRPIFVSDRVIDELVQVASDAGFMARILKLALFALPTVAGDAIELLMLVDGMRELVEL